MPSHFQLINIMFTKFLKFITLDIWRFRLKDMPKRTSVPLKILRVVILSLREFHKDKCQLRASALTYYSLVSIVPIIAMAFAVAKGFGFEEKLKNKILDTVDAEIVVVTNSVKRKVEFTNIVSRVNESGFVTNISSKTVSEFKINRVVVPIGRTAAQYKKSKKRATQLIVIEKIMAFAGNALDNTKSGLIFGIGIALLFWAVIKALGQVESSFNAIWGVKKSRSIGRKIIDYLAVLLLCPILLLLASSIPVLIRSQFDLIITKITLLGTVAPLVYNLLRLSPYVVTWFLFSFVFIFIPNTKIKFSSGIIAGIITGTLFQIVLLAYINFQFGIVKLSGIYGSFAALPLFLAWIQVTWHVVLYGSEVAFAYQNVDTYEFEPDCLKASLSFRKLVCLRIVHIIAGKFANAEIPLTTDELTHELGIPIRLMRELLFELVEAKVLDEVRTDDERVNAYQPALDVHLVTTAFVIKSLDNRGTQSVPFNESSEFGKLSNVLNSFDEAINKSPENLPLVKI